jgi:NAD(P)-dependent dehydrogenase (short-subunit alcohol dehydrogenase family)
VFIKLFVFKPTTMGILFSVFSSSKEYNLEDHGHADRAMFDEYVGSDDKFTHLQDKVVAITGTSVGSLGFYLAEIAIKKNAKVLLLLNRDSSSAKQGQEGLNAIAAELKSPIQIQSINCDMQDFAIVKTAAEQVNVIAQSNGGLDVLINNAGIMATRDTHTTDGFEVQMQTNQLSHFLLTSIVYPSLELAATTRGDARLVTHSSLIRALTSRDLEEKFFCKCGPKTLGGDDTWMMSEVLLSRDGPWTRYRMTKLANSVFAMAMHEKLKCKGSTVKALSAEPGFSSSNLQVSSTKGDGLMRGWVAKLIMPEGQSAENGCLNAAMAAFGKEAMSGDFYAPKSALKGSPVRTIIGGVEVKRGSEKLTCSKENQENLWKWCEAALQIKFDI